ncbi:MAG: hypothetical protein JW795_22420 [Chitinivibrionales bacterium]|nr:hypothetical protein [Chitinivibrionales bacterium]
MHDNKKKTIFIPKHLIMVISTLLFLSVSQTSALKPYFNDLGWLLLKVEDTYDGSHTCYTAIVGGANTWYNKYFLDIIYYCFVFDPYYTTLPHYGYTQVTAEKLVNMFTYDPDLQDRVIPAEVQTRLLEALNQDKSNGAPALDVGSSWDPINDWKWRSTFMEGRYAENGSSEEIMSNCWGNADYLTRGEEWALAYPDNKAWAIAWGISTWGATFPHIYLDGPVWNNTYSIDADLIKTSQKFELEATGKKDLRLMLNSFDIIRMAAKPNNPPTNYDLVINGTNCGKNLHCAVFICTDAGHQQWFYEKGNFGATISAPYGLRAFGQDPSWQYENSFRSYFHHDGDLKKNLAQDWTEDWWPVEP